LKKITKSFKRKQKQCWKTISENIIRQKRCQLLLTFQTHDLDHQTGNNIHEKNYEAQSLENETLKDEIKKITKKPKIKNSN